MATPAAAEWEKHVDDETQTAYYYNTRTGESSWEEPEGFVDASADDQAASATSEATGSATDEQAKPPRWRRYIDDSNGKPYYYDEANDVTQWEEPEGEVEDASDDEQDRDEDEDVDGDECAANNEGDDQEQEGEVLADAESAKEVPSASEPLTNEDAPSATDNWVKHVDKATGKPYYHDTISNTTQWEAPEHFTEAGQATAISAEYLEYLHRSRAEKLARATQRALDPEGNLSKLNALLSKIGDGGAGAVSADEVDALEDIEQDLKDRARAEWQQHVDPHTQRYYYHNIVTGETQWQKPEAPVVSALADWIPPETAEPTTSAGPTRTVSGQHYAATAKFNRVSGRFEKLGGDAYFETRGVAADREGRQMSHFFDVQQLEKNREDAKRIKEQLKRKNIDWKKVAAEKKAKKQKRQNEWIYQD